MHQVIYTSAESVKFNPEELKELLRKARIRNTQFGITGMLLYNKGSFLQVIEGEERKIDFLYTKILSDRRHNKIQMLLKKEIHHPEFQDWSMGFVDMNITSESPEGYINYDKFSALTLDTTTAQRILSQFKDGQWRQYVRH